MLMLLACHSWRRSAALHVLRFLRLRLRLLTTCRCTILALLSIRIRIRIPIRLTPRIRPRRDMWCRRAVAYACIQAVEPATGGKANGEPQP